MTATDAFEGTFDENVTLRSNEEEVENYEPSDRPVNARIERKVRKK